jgi:septal ring factor EnvC (AmiA/AmiB activator)
MRLILSIFIFVSILFSNATTVDKKMRITNSKLSIAKKKYNNTYKNFRHAAKLIVKQEQELLHLDKKIKLLKRNIKSRTKERKETKSRLQKYEKIYASSLKKVEAQKQNLINYIAENLSFFMVTSQKINSEDSLIAKEVFSQYNKIISKKITSLTQAIGSQQVKINEQNKNVKIVKLQLDSLTYKLKKLDKLSNRKVNVIKSLKIKKDTYSRNLRNIKEKRRRLSSILSKLKIVKKRSHKKRRRASKRKSNKKIASSFQNVLTYNYRGKRTIAPLKKFVVLRKYGPYEDPIYNIKIFNDSIVMKPVGRNKKVNAVLSGKIIFAKNTPSLKKVVIIQHKNKYHTIYAHLDKIAPTIRRGKMVRKGFVIGKVSSNLTFQITKQNYYINPLKFIHY